MMRIPLIAGNWKMYKTPAEAKEFCIRFKELYKDTDVQALILAPAVDLSAVAEALNGTDIMYGAQNVFYEKEGAYTGEVSCEMLKAIGCGFSIVGHSERRQYFDETDETVNLKAKALLANGLRPIICVGESEEIRLAEGQNEHVRKQLIGAF
ncbi:MAG: triosephosphate isomerase, partial [Firmicutes bacterium]|nr:triosephosphate isomerase [Bacillota bacterium]